MSGLWILVGSLARAQEEPPVIPEYHDADRIITVGKTQTLNKELAQLEALTNLLKEFGSPAKKLDGEKTPDYLDRVDRTMKARAFAIELIEQQLEKALDAKAQLTAQLKEYQIWVETLAKQLDELPKEYQQRTDKLREDLTELGRDGQVLAFLLHKAATAEGDTAKAAEYSGDFQDPNGRNLLDALPDRASREAKFASLSTEDLEDRYAQVAGQLVDKEYERDLLLSHVIVETKELAEILPEEHRKMVKEAQAVLEKSKDLEDRSAQVSVLAKYVYDNLKVVNPYKDALRRAAAIRSTLDSLPQIDVAIDNLVAGKVQSNGRRGIIRRSAAANTANTAK